jgi:hypothetical protein
MRVLGSCVILLAVGAVGWILAAGVTVTVKNRSAAPIDNVVIGYQRGEFRLDELPPSGEETRFVGRIGEGATFAIQFTQHGQHLGTRANVYFTAGGPRAELAIEISDRGRVRVLSENVVLHESIAGGAGRP